MGALLATEQADEAQRLLEEEMAKKPGDPDLHSLMARLKQSKFEAELDADASDGRSPGTFRWPQNKKLPELPADIPSSSSVTSQGWGPYLSARGGDSFVALAQTTSGLLDGLSFPLSLA